MVFDGANLPAKEVTEVSRAESRKKNLEKAEFLCQQNKSSEAYQFFSAAVDISPRMAAGMFEFQGDIPLHCWYLISRGLVH